MEETTNISKTYAQNFLLDEGKLRKIIDTLTQNMQKKTSSFEFTYEMGRRNDTKYKTKILEDIVNDDNAMSKEIKSLSIEVAEKSSENRSYIDYESRTRCTVTFAHPKYDWSTEGELSFRITGSDKGWCLIFAEDLDTQLRRTLANTNKHLVTIISFFDFLFPLILIFLLFLILGRYVYQPKPSMSSEIHNMSLDEKVNEIIEYNRYFLRKEISIYYMIAGFTGVVIIIISLVGLFQELKPFDKMSKWFNKSVFYWGDQIVIYDKYRNLTQNVKWTIIIGFIVSALAGILVALFQK